MDATRLLLHATRRHTQLCTEPFFHRDLVDVVRQTCQVSQPLHPGLKAFGTKEKVEVLSDGQLNLWTDPDRRGISRPDEWLQEPQSSDIGQTCREFGAIDSASRRR